MVRLRHPALVAVVLAFFVAMTSGCGYLLYEERRHAPASRDLDAQVVILDCLWLLAGVWPGVVALAVDFSTGAAFHAESETNPAPGDQAPASTHGETPADSRVSLRRADADGHHLTPAKPETDPKTGLAGGP